MLKGSFNFIFRSGNVRSIKKLGLKIVDFNEPPYYSEHKKQWTFKYLNNYYIVLTDKLKYTQVRKIVSALIEYEEKEVVIRDVLYSLITR